ncbi:hypothetical protein A2U01_0113846, partial [Trifolium medium]|nr:hypothetical protein [Trifolium medium]
MRTRFMLSRMGGGV